jgi:hypothetical protein
MQHYETREEYLNGFIAKARPHFERVGAPLPTNIRVSVGFTSRGAGRAKKERIAEIWSDTASGDGHFEIFVTPTLPDTARICDAVTHELIHAAVGLAANHGAHFKRVATSLGLTGPAAMTVAGEDWYAWALPIIAELGDMPYSALTADGANSARKKQKTSLLKMECPACGFIARVTRKHIAPHTHLNCPVPECDGVLVQEPDDEGDDA